MSRIMKLVVAVLVTVLVAVGALVVYRETDLLTGSLVVLAALMIVGLLARRVAVREEKAGMAEWERETMASAAAADDLFGDWKVSSPRGDAPSAPPAAPMSPSPTVAPPVRGNGASFPAPPLPSRADDRTEDPGETSTFEIPAPPRTQPTFADGRDATAADGSVPAPLAGPSPVIPPATPVIRSFETDDHGADTGDRVDAGDRTPAFAGAAAAAPASSARALIDWTGQGRAVNEQVRTSDDIMKASDATALPSAAADPAAGSELSRLLAKVEARLREYD